MSDKTYAQCFTCEWLYLRYYLDYDSTKMKEVNGNKYCPLCDPTMDELEDKLIADNRKDLARCLHMIEENPTPEQLEAEIFKERADILSMSQEELEQHVSDMDGLYRQLQKEASKVKRKTIAALEVKREKFGDAKSKKKAAKESQDEDRVAQLLAQLSGGGLGSSLKKD